MPATDRKLITPCRDYGEFMARFMSRDFEPRRDDPRFGEEDPAWPDSECRGDGWDPNPLLVAPGDHRSDGPVLVSGEIRDGKGHHPAATFLGGEHCRMAHELRRAPAARKRALKDRFEMAVAINRHAARERHENAIIQMPRRHNFKTPT